MGVAAVLQGTEALAVEPGQTATCQLNLGNTGTIVEQYTILLLGDAPSGPNRTRLSYPCSPGPSRR